MDKRGRVNETRLVISREVLSIQRVSKEFQNLIDDTPECLGCLNEVADSAKFLHANRWAGCAVGSGISLYQ